MLKLNVSLLSTLSLALGVNVGSHVCPVPTTPAGSVFSGLTHRSTLSFPTKYAEPAVDAYPLYATSTRSGPMGERTRTPTPGVTRRSENVKRCCGRFHTCPASTNVANCTRPPNDGSRYRHSALATMSVLPPVGEYCSTRELESALKSCVGFPPITALFTANVSTM